MLSNIRTFSWTCNWKMFGWKKSMKMMKNYEDIWWKDILGFSFPVPAHTHTHSSQLQVKSWRPQITSFWWFTEEEGWFKGYLHQNTRSKTASGPPSSMCAPEKLRPQRGFSCDTEASVLIGHIHISPESSWKPWQELRTSSGLQLQLLNLFIRWHHM